MLQPSKSGALGKSVKQPKQNPEVLMLDGSANCNGLIGLDVLAWLTAKDQLDSLSDA